MRFIPIYAAILFGCIYATTSALPQRNNGFEDRPQYLKFSVQDVKGYNQYKTNRRNYNLASNNQPVNQFPTGFRTSSASQESSEEDDAAPASSQQLRRPAAFENENYPNAIPQQIRQPQQSQQQQYRRPNQPPQQFRKQLEVNINGNVLKKC